MDDRKIIHLLWNRLESGVQAIAAKFGPRLHATALHILGDRRDAEESVSDTYLAIWNAIPPKQPDPLAGFVYKTGRNLALKRLRYLTADKRSGGYELSLEELAGCIPAPALEETADARELGRCIDGFLDTLSKENRCIFLRRYWFGDSVQEIASAFGMRPNTLTVRLARIREQLKHHLIQEGYHEA